MEPLTLEALESVTDLYVRVSTTEQAEEGYSVDEQTAKLQAYCVAMGYKVNRVAVDPGYSGASLDRPGIREVIADVKRGRCKKVIVWKLDRLSRSQKDTLILLEDVFFPNGCAFVSLNENFDTATPIGRCIVGVLAANGLKYSPYNDFGYGYGYGYGYDFGYNYGSRLSGGSAAVLAIISLMLIAYVVVEFVFYAKGKSIGKAILGLQVVSSTNGKPFSFWRMMFREILVKQASGVLMLGFIWILVDEKNRGWHDKILDSYVVDLKESEKMNLKKKLERTEEMAYKAERTAAPKEEPAPAPEKPAEKAETEVKDPESTPAPAPRSGINTVLRKTVSGSLSRILTIR